MIKMIFYFTNEIQIFLHNILNANNNNNKIITQFLLYISFTIYSLHKLTYINMLSLINFNFI